MKLSVMLASLLVVTGIALPTPALAQSAADAAAIQRVLVAETFPLERASHAHRAGELGHTTGKLVLTT